MSVEVYLCCDSVTFTHLSVFTGLGDYHCICGKKSRFKSFMAEEAAKTRMCKV